MKTPHSFEWGIFVGGEVHTSAFSASQNTVTLRTLGPTEFPENYAARLGIIINGIVAALGLIQLIGIIGWHAD